VLEPILHSGILLAAVTAVVLNLVYNGWERAQDGAHAH
jgi:xanthine/uracil permease